MVCCLAKNIQVCLAQSRHAVAPILASMTNDLAASKSVEGVADASSVEGRATLGFDMLALHTMVSALTHDAGGKEHCKPW